MHTSEDFPKVGNYSFVLDVDGWPLKVTYKYHPFCREDFQGFHLEVNDDSCHHIHFAFYGKAASETGFRSHFCHVRDLVRDPYSSAWLIAQGLYSEMKKKHPKLVQKEVQLSLF